MNLLAIARSRRVAAALVAALTAGSAAWADNGSSSVNAKLTGYQETPAALSTPAAGRFKAKIDDKAGTIEYELSTRRASRRARSVGRSTRSIAIDADARRRVRR